MFNAQVYSGAEVQPVIGSHVLWQNSLENDKICGNYNFLYPISRPFMAINYTDGIWLDIEFKYKQPLSIVDLC